MRLSSICSLLLLFLAACHHNAEDKTPIAPPQKSDLTSDAHAWADSVCASLSLQQKIAQLFMPALFSSDDYFTLLQVKEYADSGIGGLLLLKGDTSGARHIADTISSLSKVLPFIAIDAEWGLAMRLTDAPGFPTNGKIAKDIDERVMYDYGHEVAEQCRGLGINMVLGPVVDVSAPGGYMKWRTLGDDPVRVADLSIAYARGLEDGGLISVAKHFPGHGSVSADSHLRKGVVARSLNQMDSIDLYPFKKWIEQRLSAIMVGHLAVPSIDSHMLPAAVSPTVINDLLREDLGFTGLIITDAINMKGAEGFSGVDAIKAGADIIIAPIDTSREIEKVMQAVDEGSLSESEIDDHVKRILFYKYLSGLRKTGKVSNPDFQIDPAASDSISKKLDGVTFGATI